MKKLILSLIGLTLFVSNSLLADKPENTLLSIPFKVYVNNRANTKPPCSRFCGKTYQR